MSLEFENELYDMTSAAKPLLLDDDLPWYLDGHTIFEEVPYFGYRTDLVTARLKGYRLEKRLNAVGHFTPLPDERKYRQSYRALQKHEPLTRTEWVKDNTTYVEQTSRKTWDWLADHGYLRPVSPEEVGGQQRLPVDDASEQSPIFDDMAPAVTVKFPDVVDVVAWELKQTDWETALQQATRAECYADNRMVLMDAGGVDEALDHRNRFTDAGVGLASLDADGVDVHIHAGDVHPPQTSTREMLAERALAAVDEEVLEEVLPDDDD